MVHVSDSLTWLNPSPPCPSPSGAKLQALVCAAPVQHVALIVSVCVSFLTVVC